MGGFSSFAVSFSIISVLTGCITAYADAIGPGRPAALGLGWPLVSVRQRRLGVDDRGHELVGQVAIVAANDFGCASELAATLALGGRRWSGAPMSSWCAACPRTSCR